MIVHAATLATFIPIFALVALTASVGGTQEVATPARPETYDGFVDASRHRSLARAIANASQVYVRPGNHVVENPIVIDRDGPLFLHGADRMGTSIVGKNQGKPLFLIRRATAVGFAGLRLIANQDPNGVDQVAVRMENAAPLWLEIFDGVIEDSRLEVGGPGDVRIQAVSFMPHGRVSSSVLVDHPDARVTIVGGNVSNNQERARFDVSEAAHLWQKRGRLRVFGTGMQSTLGPSDIRIETPSNTGLHALVGVRSEGANGSNRGVHPCRLLVVPKTPLAVDVLVEANSIVCGPLGRSDGAFVDYNARGSLWLIGNNALPGAASLVVGDTSASRIIAVGNLLQHAKALVPTTTAVVKVGANLAKPSRLSRSPGIRFAPPQPALAKGTFAPPKIRIPDPLTRPRMSAALPGMLDAWDFGAKGDGVHDDTRALQRALDVSCGEKPKLLFLRAGTYRTTETLRFNHERSRCRKHVAGGWIAGAGADRTTIRRDPLGRRGGVFATQGMAYATIQGLRFETRAYDPARERSAIEPAFALEYERAIGPASQGVSFYDIVFDGGSSAIAIGVESPEQCSENVFVDASFRNGRFGLAVGAYNALANIVYRGSFENNDVSMGHPDDALSGGTWMVLGARIRGTRDRDLSLRNSATSAWYMNGIDSDTPRLVAVGGTGAAFPIILEDSTFRPRETSPEPRFILFGGGGGVIFLHSSVSRLRPSLLGGGLASSYFVGLDSDLPDLSGVTLGPNAIATRGAVATAGASGAGGGDVRIDPPVAPLAPVAPAR